MMSATYFAMFTKNDSPVEFFWKCYGMIHIAYTKTQPVLQDAQREMQKVVKLFDENEFWKPSTEIFYTF